MGEPQRDRHGHEPVEQEAGPGVGLRLRREAGRRARRRASGHEEVPDGAHPARILPLRQRRQAHRPHGGGQAPGDGAPRPDHQASQGLRRSPEAAPGSAREPPLPRGSPRAVAVRGSAMSAAAPDPAARAMAELDAEWTAAPDGVLEREAARIVVFDPDGRLLFIRGHDVDDPDHSWWFTVGGGVGGEGLREGALRELLEETGLRPAPSRLEGPVLVRDATFRFAREVRRQHECFFLLRLDGSEAASVVAGYDLTAIEREVIDEYAWWWPRDVRRAESAGEVFYPVGIAGMAESWWSGWDGTTPHVAEA
ncbi:MAG: NUDIX domain-containing protein [Actinomyces sp.]|nr:MAG: NUDIX domain-containing protein [Actinomyces sp.]